MSLFHWISSALKIFILSKNLKQKSSQECSVNVDVLQGSAFGPSLFLQFLSTCSYTTDFFTTSKNRVDRRISPFNTTLSSLGAWLFMKLSFLDRRNFYCENNIRHNIVFFFPTHQLLVLGKLQNNNFDYFHVIIQNIPSFVWQITDTSWNFCLAVAQM